MSECLLAYIIEGQHWCEPCAHAVYGSNGRDGYHWKPVFDAEKLDGHAECFECGDPLVG